MFGVAQSDLDPDRYELCQRHGLVSLANIPRSAGLTKAACRILW